MNSGKRDRDAFEPPDGQEGRIRNRPRIGDDSTGDGDDSVNHGDPHDAPSGDGGTFHEGSESSANSSDDEEDDEGSIIPMEVIRDRFASYREVNQFELSERLEAVLERIPLTKSRLAYALDPRRVQVDFDEGWQEFRLRRELDTLIQEGWTFADLVEEVLNEHLDHVARDRLHYGVFIWLNSEVVLHVGGRLCEPFTDHPLECPGCLPTLFCPLQIQHTSRSGFTIPVFDVLAMSQEGVLEAIPGVMHLLSADRPTQISIWAYGTTTWTFNSYNNYLGELAVSKGFTSEFLIPGKSLREFLEHNPELEWLRIRNDPFLFGQNPFNLEQAEAIIHYAGDGTELDLEEGCREVVDEAHTLRKNLASLRGDLRAPLVGLAIGKVIKRLERRNASCYATSLIFVTLREHVGLLFGNGRFRGQPRS